LTRHLEVEAGWRGVAERGDVRWEMELTGGARLAVTEGEGVVTGLRKLEEETAFGLYAKAAQAGMGRAHARGLQEKRGAVRLAGLRGWMGWLAAGPIGPKVKEKFFSE
jgi:hypothetical protein